MYSKRTNCIPCSGGLSVLNLKDKKDDVYRVEGCCFVFGGDSNNELECHIFLKTHCSTM